MNGFICYSYLQLIFLSHILFFSLELTHNTYLMLIGLLLLNCVAHHPKTAITLSESGLWGLLLFSLPSLNLKSISLVFGGRQ